MVQLILLLLPVPKSIMMCLFLKHTQETTTAGYEKATSHGQPCRGEGGWRILPEKEHDGAGVVQLVHLVEVWHLCDVHQVNDSEVLHLCQTQTTYMC